MPEYDVYRTVQRKYTVQADTKKKHNYMLIKPITKIEMYNTMVVN